MYTTPGKFCSSDANRVREGGDVVIQVHRVTRFECEYHSLKKIY